MYPHIFPLHWIKGTLIEFSIPFTIFWELETGGGGGGGGLGAWKGVGKTGKLLYLQEKQLHKA